MSSYSSDLLAQARQLARNEPRRPKQSSLRRSISASYYSLFHFLIAEASKMMVGASQERKNVRLLAGRGFDHGKMKAACLEFAKATPKSIFQPSWAAHGVVGNPDLPIIIDNFVELQSVRHLADYDLSHQFTRQDALVAIGLSEEAIEAWKRLKGTDQSLAVLFVTVMSYWPVLGGR